MKRLLAVYLWWFIVRAPLVGAPDVVLGGHKAEADCLRQLSALYAIAYQGRYYTPVLVKTCHEIS